MPGGSAARERKRVWQAVFGLTLLCLLLYVWDLGLSPFYNYEEPKEALVVWEMVNGGGWILPLRNGDEIPLKPPLLHWLGAVISVVSGVLNEFTVRLPSALAALAGVLLTFYFGQRLWGWRAGLLAGLVLATSPEWMRWAVTARSDMLLTVFSTAALVVFWQIWEERKPTRRKVCVFYALLGVAALAKGPVGVAMPLLVVVAFLWVSGDLAFWRKLCPVEGIAVLVVVALSWYGLALWRGGWEFFRVQILDENVFRILHDEGGGPSRDHPFYYYVPALIVGMFPWSVFFPALGMFLFRQRGRLKEKRLVYPLVWCLVTLVVFTLASGKRSNYVLGLYPAVALLVGLWVHVLVEGREAGVARKLAAICAWALLGAFGTLFLVLLAQGAGLDLERFAAPFLHPRDRANLPLVAHTLQSRFALVAVWLACLAMALGAHLWGLTKRHWILVFSSITIYVSASFHFTHALFRPLLAQPRTYKPFMLGVRDTVREEPLFFYKARDYGAIFYADRRIADYGKDLLQGRPDGAASPLFLLMWEETWHTLSANGHLRLLALSEGRGPDKDRRLALVVLVAAPEKAAAEGS